MQQLDLMSWQPRGATYKADRDQARLGEQCQRVYRAMRDGAWHTLGQLGELTGDPEASISARLRDLRNQFGFTVEREFVARGLHRYRLS